MRDTREKIKSSTRIAMAVLAALFVTAGLGAKEITLGGMVRSYTAARFSGPDIAVNEQTLDFTLEGWGDMTRAFINPSATAGIGLEPEISLREAYIDVFLDSMDIRIGRQAIMWGQAEGAFITDIVSPRDMRSFILEAGAELFTGDSDGTFGTYSGNSLAWAALRWYF